MTSSPLSKPELQALRDKAARGAFLSFEEVRAFVAATRQSYLAAEVRGKPKDRTAKEKPDNQAEIDFF
jgi:hypothetical protein